MTFEEWWETIPYPKMVKTIARKAWNFRQAEIDFLKKEIAELRELRVALVARPSERPRGHICYDPEIKAPTKGGLEEHRRKLKEKRSKSDR